ncbi:ApaG domain [Opitutaceae bacterium TAV4]|nr:ApaG domain [Opitutaceae bacterium TAV4]RRJ98515.1 ApaG domain [Opitutaceae bacterium TAV3]
MLSHRLLLQDTLHGRLQTGPGCVCSSVSKNSTVPASIPLPGLSARLDKLVYHYGGKCLPEGKPHAFVYFITFRNDSEHTVTLLARKWVIVQEDGTRIVVEGDKIVGETPRLAPGEEFSYSSYHIAAVNGVAHGSFHGIDDQGRRVYTVLPAFTMRVPQPVKSPTSASPARRD